MFQDLDTALRNVLDDPAAPTALRAATVTFLSPDRTFRDSVSSKAVNLFLHRIQENRELRDNVPFNEPSDPPNVRRPPLLRVDCSYLVTAWSKLPGEAEVVEEHLLLGLAIKWLSRFPLIPQRFLPPSLLRDDFPLPYAVVAFNDPDRVPVDFWTALGIAPRPSFDLTVTIAIDLEQAFDDGPLVIDRGLTIFRTDLPDGPKLYETLHSIGGTVVRASDKKPVLGATVRLIERNLETLTDDQGRFRFDGILGDPSLPQISFNLRASAPGLVTKTRSVQVPNDTKDEYDFEL